MTPEEKAVLKAAEELYDCGVEARGRWEGSKFRNAYDTPLVPEMWYAFGDAVRALRASREPKPRYSVTHTQGLISQAWDVGCDGVLVARCLAQFDANRIAALLNEADK